MQTFGVPWSGGEAYFDVDDTLDSAEVRAALVDALATGNGNAVLYGKIAAVAKRFNMKSDHRQSAHHDWHFVLEALPPGPHEPH